MSFSTLSIAEADDFSIFLYKGTQTDWGSPLTSTYFIRTQTNDRWYAGNNTIAQRFNISGLFGSYLLSSIKTGVNAALYKNGSSFWNISGSVGSYGTTTISEIFKATPNNPGTQMENGHVHEVIIYESDQSTNRTDIEGNINAHYGIANIGTPSSGLLADYPGSAAAYSVRKLADTASLAMRIIVDDTAVIGTVDASDTEYDIGFDANGDLDVARIREVCNNPSGANYNAYVVTWYDQSGNGNHATQTTYTNCPQIYDGVDVITLNGKTAIHTPNADQDLVCSGTNALSQVYTVNAVGQGGHPYAYNGGSSRIFMTSSTVRFKAGTEIQVSGINASGNQTTVFCVADGTNSTIHAKNSGAQVNTTGDAGTQGIVFDSTFQIGNRSSFVNGGYTQELVFWGSDQSSNRKAIETDIDSYYRIYGDPDDGLLSTPYGKGAAAAYSVRRLSNNATRAMRILVDADANGPDASDNEYDIGFDVNGELDIARIEELCDKGTGNYDAYVTTWYDQSGEGNDATQATYSAMPKICNAGTVILENGKPALDFDGDGRFIEHTPSSINLGTNDHYVSGVLTVGTNANTNQVWLEEEGGTSNRYLFWWQNSNTTLQLYANTVVGSGTASTKGDQYLLTGTRVGTTSTLFKNGVSSISGTASDFDSTGDLKIGINISELGNQSWDGVIQEIVIWASDESSDRTLIEANINDYFNIEGV